MSPGAEPAGRWSAPPRDRLQLEALQGTRALQGGTKPCRGAPGQASASWDTPVASAGCAQGAAGRWHPWHHKHCPGSSGSQPTDPPPPPGQLRRGSKHTHHCCVNSLPLLCINHYAIPFYFQFTCIFLVEPQTCPWVCGNSPHQPLPCLGATASCCQGTRHHLGRTAGLWVRRCQQCSSLVPCPAAPSLGWARRPRSQGLRGKAEPVHFTTPSCVQSHHPASSSDSLVRSISPPGAVTLGGVRQAREELLSPRPWQAAPTSPRRCPAEG